VQDPFETYRARIAEKESRRDNSDEAVAARAAKKAKKENDRTTWLGTDLGVKGQKRVREEDTGGVGKYLGGKPSTSSTTTEAPASASFGVESKKQKKLGSFGNFSGW
jgi:peptidyl-prolyl cis-trans isomerase-like 2